MAKVVVEAVGLVTAAVSISHYYLLVTARQPPAATVDARSTSVSDAVTTDCAAADVAIRGQPVGNATICPGATGITRPVVATERPPDAYSAHYVVASN